MKRLNKIGVGAVLSLLANSFLLLTSYNWYVEMYPDAAITRKVQHFFQVHIYYYTPPVRNFHLSTVFDSRSIVPSEHMLAVMICSLPVHKEKREIIRRTWMNWHTNLSSENVFAKFVIGTGSLESRVIQQLEEENSQHNDMILFSGMVDDYLNSSHKVLAGLSWFDKHVNYSYLLKCDDDSFALLDRIEEQLYQRNHSRGLYWGYFVGNDAPQGKWSEHNWRFCDTYFPYAYGGGYVLSADVVCRIAANADALIVYNNEDVSVGAWTVVYDIERRHDVRFDTATTSRGCKNYFLITRLASETKMEETASLYSQSGEVCHREYLAWEDEYNWDMLPSSCYWVTPLCGRACMAMCVCIVVLTCLCTCCVQYVAKKNK